jgi:glutamate synthase (NADPH/NADH) large chain/glutamate synthase (ferredoxin)
MYPVIPQSLYDPRFEHDACGVGFIANTNGNKEFRILEYAIEALKNLAHRGALDADAKTGDGAGVLTQIPHELFRPEVEKLGGKLAQDSDLAVGMVFLTAGDSYKQSLGQKIIEEAAREFGIHIFGWRKVPVQPSCLGDKARSTMPEIQQILMGRTGKMSPEEFERSLFLARKVAGQNARRENLDDFYISSFSSRTIVYKGLFNAPQLPRFFEDLQNPAFKTSLAIYHQRYSTNTFPNWKLAHPFRTVAHNGEINTLMGNMNWVRARERDLTSPIWGDRVKHIKPVIQEWSSDSAALDNAVELLELSGRNILQTVMMLIPEAWEKNPDVTGKLRGFYRYHSCISEPWDGPAAVVFSDGRYIGATLDRNGLRPARYIRYDDGLIVMGSEAGVVPLDESKVVEKGRLGPGRIMAIDTVEGKFLSDGEIKEMVASAKPYDKWCEENLFSLTEHAKPFEPNHSPVNLIDLTVKQITFGWDDEEIKVILHPMVEKGAEAVGSMGDDTPLNVLSRQPRLLYGYFRQRFAQVTNPPIDSIREKVVMSLSTTLGYTNSWLEETIQHAKKVAIDSPFLLDYELEALRQIPDEAFKAQTFSAIFSAEDGPEGLPKALDSLCSDVEKAVDEGISILILSDRRASKRNIPIPMMLAVGAVHHHLINAGKRLRCSIVCETGEARDVHHFACLIGYGATAVNPYIAIDTIREAIEMDNSFGDIELDQALGNYRQAIEKGLLKIMSKMGISTIKSYRGAQIFEAVGISRAVIDRCFYGTSTQMEGISMLDIARDAIRRHAKAYADPETARLEEGGNYKVLPGDRGEFHAFNKKVVQTMHKFLRTGKRDEFLAYMETVKSRDPVSPRDLLKLKAGNPIPLEEVESIENIRQRFTTAGMSLGALSPEAHECLAIAMNSIGGKSNSGEGGEDKERYHIRDNGDNPSSAIKQVASGRFGVTPEYLASAKEIEIKMAQGAKPGEGGQLPGHKVTSLIAKLRYSVPGVPLISPPPHHDIYSIEDLAQLIYDLKQVNPRAKVCVKLVSSAGVGTVAAGVAKAYADVVLISGHDGGTGASPQSSIKYAGGPWELGVADAHQTLMLNDLRSRIVVRTDGGMKTGQDIIMAALLGAEEYNFGTAALVAAGCAMFRVCHLNTCPVGVATQKDELRLKFRGKPENVVAFFNGVAEEVREIMAQLGFRKMDDLIGRTDLLERRPLDEFPEEIRSKIAGIDLSRMLYQVDPTGTSPRIHTRERNERFGDSSLDDKMIIDAKKALNNKGSVKLSYRINNTMRNIGTRISGHIGYTYGDAGLPDASVDVRLEGSAGQSFGTFLAKGMKLTLIGEANDYVGKGMNGGEIILRPPEVSKFDWSQNQIVGNTVLYGATGGKLFAAGRAGERFGVRNSGATAVIEGVGDHGCEYMTGGTVIILGNTGRNFGAGMSGGRAYVLDPDNKFPSRFNDEMVGIEKLMDHPDEAKTVEALVYEHLEKTESPKANELLKSWSESVKHFWVVVPRPAEARPAGKPVHELAEKSSENKPPVGGF